MDASQKPCRLVLLFSILLFFFVISASQIDSSYAETAQRPRVCGYVFDYVSHQPLFKAQIGCRFGEKEEIIAETNMSGYFEAHVEGFGRFTFFVYCDDASTPGVDYVPAQPEVFVEEDPHNVSFWLLPGASINATGDPFFSFEDSVFSCSLVCEDKLWELMGSNNEVWGWRSGPQQRTVIAPANTDFRIEVNVYETLEAGYDSWKLERTAHFFIPYEGNYLNLKQGEQIPVNLKAARLNFEASIEMPERLNSTKSTVEEIGVLGSYERIRISSAEELLMRAQASISGCDYVHAQADLYESYLILQDVKEAILSLFQNSVLSLYFITPFIAVTSSSLGAIFFKDKPRRIITSIVFYSFFIVMLYFVYPGYTFVQNPSYNPLAGTFLESSVMPLLVVFSLFLGLILINGPYTYGEKTDRSSLSLRSAILATFSLAVDNLKRRKLRTILTVIFMLISVFAFMMTTSYSYEVGFAIEQKTGTAPSEGIFVFQQALNRILPFGPVDIEIIKWLREQSEVVLAVPLLKNVPQVGTPPPPIGVLSNPNSGLNYSVSGVLGIKPSSEINLTRINQIVDQGESSGRFLNDMDFNGILISQEAKEALAANVGDTITFCDRNFTVIGTFRSERLRETKDLNGDPIIPQQVQVVQGFPFFGSAYLPGYVASEKVIITVSETASKLPLNIVVSRVNVQTQRREDITSLARTLVLLFPSVETYASVDGKIHHLFIGSYQVVKGFAESAVLLVLVVLNVGMMMLNVVYERRREVVTMSTIGINPSQITAIFASEAFVMAFIAGSLGYLLGLNSYIFLSFFPPTLQYKVEASWGMLALCFSISASVLGSIIPASRASVIATPSLLRRFIVTPKEKTGEAWTLEVPIKIKEADLERFFDFIEERLKVFNYPVRLEERVDNIVRKKEKDDPSSESLHFIYKFDVNKIITEDRLFPVWEASSNQYSINLASKSLLPRTSMGKKTSARQTASFIRRLALEYTERDKM